MKTFLFHAALFSASNALEALCCLCAIQIDTDIDIYMYMYIQKVAITYNVYVLNSFPQIGFDEGLNLHQHFRLQHVAPCSTVHLSLYH